MLKLHHRQVVQVQIFANWAPFHSFFSSHVWAWASNHKSVSLPAQSQWFHLDQLPRILLSRPRHDIVVKLRIQRFQTIPTPSSSYRWAVRRIMREVYEMMNIQGLSDAVDNQISMAIKTCYNHSNYLILHLFLSLPRHWAALSKKFKPLL